MKKLFFTAIALVAFSGVSMASNIEITDENPPVDCVAVAIAALDAADPNNQMTSLQAHNFYQGQYDACIKSTTTKPVVKSIQ